MDELKNLIMAAYSASYGAECDRVALSAEFERRVMVAIARAETDRLRRRASIAAIAAAACFAGLVVSFPLASIARSVGQVIEKVVI